MRVVACCANLSVLVVLTLTNINDGLSGCTEMQRTVLSCRYAGNSLFSHVEHLFVNCLPAVPAFPYMPPALWAITA
jgi:hypothetical protein